VTPRHYTTQTRAKRIALHYFKRPHPLRTWKLVLSIAAPVIAAGWLLSQAAGGDQELYASGPVSTAHAMFGAHCRQCHRPAPDPAAGVSPPEHGFWLGIFDQTCQICHGAPAHSPSEPVTPQCATCHVEHQGRPRLASIGDRHCTQCHADLHTKDNASTVFDPNIRGFADGHPEFGLAIREAGQVRRVRLHQKEDLKDGAQVKLNHQRHLRPNLGGIDVLKERTQQAGTPPGMVDTPRGLQLTCTYCHEPDGGRAYMQPISYRKHCGPACHELHLEKRKFPEALAPHDTPLIVRAFLRDFFTEASACQGPQKSAPEVKERCQRLGLWPDQVEAEQPDQPRRRLRQDGPSTEGSTDSPRRRPDPPESAADWIAGQIQRAESVLFQEPDGCQKCHTLSSGDDRPLPEVAPTAIPIRWLPHSRFDHGAHRMVSCVGCHDAERSTETTDVLLPSIAVCRECHRESGGARAACVECHLYHDKSKDRDLNGPFTVRELRPPRP
jgi:hypothetical protein